MRFLSFLLIGMMIFTAGCEKAEVSDGEVVDMDFWRDGGKPLYDQEIEGTGEVSMAFVDDYAGMKLRDVVSDCGAIIGKKGQLFGAEDFLSYVGNAGWMPVISVATEKELTLKWYEVGMEFSEEEGMVASGENKLVKEEVVVAKKCEDGKSYVSAYLEGSDEISLWGAYLVEIYDRDELIYKVNFSLAQ